MNSFHLNGVILLNFIKYLELHRYIDYRNLFKHYYLITSRESVQCGLTVFAIAVTQPGLLLASQTGTHGVWNPGR
jgi:hypothetical protein